MKDSINYFKKKGIMAKRQCAGQILVNNEFILCINSGKWVRTGRPHRSKWNESEDHDDFLEQMIEIMMDIKSI